MNIEEFVKTTIEQIKANLEITPGGPKSGDTYIKEPVEFDLAVTVAENNSKEDAIKGGGNIKIASIDSESNNRKESKNEMVSRVRFSIHIYN
ncbi:hypothetical protein IJ101_03005 [Candidatus Saccharibacteria bacterium]|nr:hypothetical protein [Candidatus Saccharibacteria bacterium]